MTVAMKVRKGDLVQVLSGKDRGKQGRVIDALPRERRVIVENLNVVKRHTRPKPVKNASRMGGAHEDVPYRKRPKQAAETYHKSRAANSSAGLRHPDQAHHPCRERTAASR